MAEKDAIQTISFSMNNDQCAWVETLPRVKYGVTDIPADSVSLRLDCQNMHAGLQLHYPHVSEHTDKLHHF